MAAYRSNLARNLAVPSLESDEDVEPLSGVSGGGHSFGGESECSSCGAFSGSQVNNNNKKTLSGFFLLGLFFENGQRLGVPPHPRLQKCGRDFFPPNTCSRRMHSLYTTRLYIGNQLPKTHRFLIL